MKTTKQVMATRLLVLFVVLSLAQTILIPTVSAADWVAVSGHVYWNGVAQNGAYVEIVEDYLYQHDYTAYGGYYGLGSDKDSITSNGGTVRATYSGHYNTSTFTSAGGVVDIYITDDSPSVNTASWTCSPTTPRAGIDLVSFWDQSTGSPTGWDWDFGDGTAHATTQNPTHLYSVAGTYTITLTASGDGWSDAETKTNHIVVSAPTGAGATIAMQQSSYTFEMTNQTISIPVVLTGIDGVSTYSVEYSTYAGSAAAGTNYEAVAGTLSFGAGETMKTIDLDVYDDGTIGYNKMFTVGLFNPVGGTISTGLSSATITLLGHKGNSSMINGPIRLWFSTGKIVKYRSVVVDVRLDSANGSLVGGSLYTGSDGMASINSLPYGQHVYCHAVFNGPYRVDDQQTQENYAFDVNFDFSANEQDYYIDIMSPTRCDVNPASISASYPLHSVQITIEDTGKPVTGIPVVLYAGDNYDIKVINKTTDDSGLVSLSAMGSTKFDLKVGGKYNYEKNYYHTFPLSTYTINVGTFKPPNPFGFIGDGVHWVVDAFSGFGSNVNSSGAAYGGVGGNAYAPQSVYGGARPLTDGPFAPAVYCWCNDSLNYAQTFDYNLTSTPIGSNVSTTIGTSQQVGSNETNCIFAVADPYNKNFLLTITAHQPGGDVILYYEYYWPGPNWRLPGVPVSLYPWVSIGIIGAVFLGTAARRNIGMAGITGTVSTAFIAGSGWMAAWGPTIWPILLFCILISVLFYWRQANKGEV